MLLSHTNINCVLLVQEEQEVRTKLTVALDGVGGEKVDTRELVSEVLFLRT